MKHVRHLVVLCLMTAWSLDTHAFETDTHELVLTREAANRSVLQTDLRVLRDLGLEKSITDTAQKFPDATGEERTIRGLIEIGSVFEDNLISLLPLDFRVTRHFYNPLTGKGIDEGDFPNQTTSPAWALAPRGSISVQEFSYWDARQYLFDALTKPSEVDRKRAFGLTFKTLGHVIHHLQDMAQPQHVRNDVHCSVPGFCQAAGLKYAPSWFERWTNQSDIRDSIARRDTNPASVGYDITGAAFTSAFNSPRRFWHTLSPGADSPEKGKGIAEFTNRNFVSAGTNFDKPQQPSPPFFARPAFDPTKKSEPTVAELCNNTNLDPPCPPSMTARPQARLTFYETTGHDNFLDVPFTNPRASSESIFDERLRVQGEQPVFALNRFNFDEAYKHLIPRAVAYSAGMINYFFRGKLDAEPASPGTLLVKNLSREAMQGDFGLYYDDAQGNRRPVAITACRVGSVDIQVAQGKCKGAALLSVNADPNARLSVTFDAPVSPAPKNAGEYMLVFSGDMGEEKADPANGVVGAVVGKKIAQNGALLGTVFVTSGVFRLFRSTDFGESWAELGNLVDLVGQLTYIGNNAVLAARALSTDSGASWSSLASSGFDIDALRVTAAPTATDRLVGVRIKSNPSPTPSEVQVHFSTDRGVTWTAGQTIPGLGFNVFKPIYLGENRLVMKSYLFSRTGPCDFSATCNFFEPGLFASADGGGSWNKIFDGDLNHYVYLGKVRSSNGELVPDPNGTDGMFANTFVRLGSGDFEHRFLRSLDGGQSWTRTGFPPEMALGPPSFYDLAHLIYAGNRTLLAYFRDRSGAGNHALFKSTDYGTTWQRSGNPPETPLGLFGMVWVGGTGAIPGFQ